MKLAEHLYRSLGFKRYRPKPNLKEVEESRLKDLGFKKYEKKEPVWALKTDKPFKCNTLEGDDIHGKAGDYLCIGTKGEVWPIDQEVFEATYEEI